MKTFGLRQLRRGYNNRRGSTLAFIAISGVVLLGVTGLAVDGGYIYLTSNQLQNAADAAALAGAAELAKGPDAAIVKAEVIGQANVAAGAPVKLGPADNEGTVQVGRFASGQFVDGGTPANAIKVIARRPSLPLLFGPVVNVNTANVETSAVAVLGGNYGAGVLILDRTANDSLLIKGSANTLTVDNGSVIVNSSSAIAINTNGTGDQIQADLVGVVGGWPSSSGFGGELSKLSKPVDDPIYMRGIRAPDYLNSTLYPDRSNADSANVLPAGYYPTGLPEPKKGVLTLGPGVFCIKGQNLGVYPIIADQGTMIFLVDKYIDLQSSTARLTIVPPSSGGDYDGIAIWQAAADSGKTTAIMQGGPDVNVKGTVYVPNGTLKMGGNPGCFGNQLIVNKLELNGNVNITIDYNGNFPIPGGRAYLVK